MTHRGCMRCRRGCRDLKVNHDDEYDDDGDGDGDDDGDDDCDGR